MALTLALYGSDEAEMGERYGVDHTTLCKAHPHAPQYALRLHDVTAFVADLVRFMKIQNNVQC